METDNELIAEFMGSKPYEDSRYGTLWPDPTNGNKVGFGLKYDSSWDWLMPVIKKIYEISDPDMRELFDDLFELRITSGKSTVYNAVIEFIKWYNQQKQ